jgi:hypothetical protein
LLVLPVLDRFVQGLTSHLVPGPETP